MFNNKTKWLALHKYSYGFNEYMVFTRIDKRNGMFDFKTKKIAGYCNDTIAIHICSQDVFNELEGGATGDK